MMITNLKKRVSMLDDRVDQAIKQRKSQGYIAGLMNLRNIEKLQLMKMEAMNNGRS